jgi:hypothetical protein
MFKDNQSLTATKPILSDPNRSTLVESDLYDATKNLIQVGSVTDLVGDNNDKNDAIRELTSKSGWYVTLGTYNRTTDTFQPIGEKVVGGSVSIGGATYFATNTPAASVSQTNECSSNLGESRLYALNFETGGAILDLNKSTTTTTSGGSGGTSASTVLTTADRYQIQPGGGFAPSPVAAVVKLSDLNREAVIIGTSVLQTPRQDLNKRHSIYWGLQID